MFNLSCMLTNTAMRRFLFFLFETLLHFQCKDATKSWLTHLLTRYITNGHTKLCWSKETKESKYLPSKQYFLKNSSFSFQSRFIIKRIFFEKGPSKCSTHKAFFSNKQTHNKDLKLIIGIPNPRRLKLIPQSFWMESAGNHFHSNLGERIPFSSETQWIWNLRGKLDPSAF